MMNEKLVFPEVYTFDPGDRDLREIRGLIREIFGVHHWEDYDSCIIDLGIPRKRPVRELIEVGELCDPGDLVWYRKYLQDGWYRRAILDEVLDPDGKVITIPRTSPPEGVLRLLRYLIGHPEKLEVLRRDPDTGFFLCTEENLVHLRLITDPVEFFEFLIGNFSFGIRLLKDIVLEYLDSLTDSELLSDFPIPGPRNLHGYIGQFALYTDSWENTDDHCEILFEIFGRFRRWYVR